MFFQYPLKEKQELLRTFLSTTRLTLNFESESPLHQHLVPLYARRLVMIGMTGVHVKGRRDEADEYE